MKEHKDEMTIYKLRNNKKLTKDDIVYLEDIMFNELGTQVDYKKECGDISITKLVRKITGLDRNAAMEEFSELLNNKNLNSSQVHFISLIIDNRVLTEDPFRTVGNIIELFRDDIDVRTKLLGKIKEIKKMLWR